MLEFILRRGAPSCYVEPAVGVGDPSTVAGRAKDEQQLISTPLRASRRVILGCETTLE